MPVSRLVVPLAGVAVSALLLAACSSSGSGSSATGSASTTATASASATSSAPATTASSTAATSTAALGTAAASSASATASAPGAATVAQLQKIVLRPGDLPSTFKAVKAEPDTGNDSTTALLQACTGEPGAPDSHKVATAQSDDYQLGTLTVSSEFSSYRSQSDVKADVAQLDSPKINQCLNSVFKTQLAQSLGTGATLNDVSIRLTPGSSGGPSNIVGTALGTVTFTAAGKRGTVYLGIAFVTGPQLDGTLSYFGQGVRLDNTTAGKALALVAERAAKA